METINYNDVNVILTILNKFIENYKFDFNSDKLNIDVDGWEILSAKVFTGSDIISGVDVVYSVPNIAGYDRFCHIITNYHDVIEIKWDNNPDRFLDIVTEEAEASIKSDEDVLNELSKILSDRKVHR